MSLPLTPEIASLKVACDQFVAASEDPDRAMSLFVRTWALGAAISDDVLDDLVQLAVSAALHGGLELTLPQVLEEVGQHERAQRIRDAVDFGRARWLETVARAGRLHDVVTARREAAGVS